MAGAGLGGRAKLKGDAGLVESLWLLFCMSWGPWEGFKQRRDTVNLHFQRTALAIAGGWTEGSCLGGGTWEAVAIA